MFSVYNFWDKYLRKLEAKAKANHYFGHSDIDNMLPRFQIERNKKLSQEQKAELLERYDYLHNWTVRDLMRRFTTN